MQVGSKNEPTTGDSATVLISSAVSSPRRSTQVSSPSTSRGSQISMSLSANIAAPLVPTESQPRADVGSSEGDLLLNQAVLPVPLGQQPQQGQSSEIVTSSSGSINASSQQVPNETTSSSTGQATQSQGTRGAGSVTHHSLRRGIQRQPIVWDSASSRPQGTSSVPQLAGRGIQGTRSHRGQRARRAGRGMFGAGRGLPRGGGS